jgi:hypothetical protein
MSRQQARRLSAEDVIAFVRSAYKLGVTTTGEPFWVHKQGARQATLLTSRDVARQELAAAIFKAHNSTATTAALNQALDVLIGQARQSVPVELPLRAHAPDGAVWIDLGWPKAKCAIRVTSSGWSKPKRLPVSFRRTALTAPLPSPQSGGSLEEIRELMNISDDAWPLVLTSMASAFHPNFPRPGLLLQGPHGSGKSSFALVFCAFTDPSTAPLGALPNNPKDWRASLDARQVVVMDNVTELKTWQEDAAARAITRDSSADRLFYTNRELDVASFQRLLVVTSIGLELRPDLASRFLVIETAPISPKRRLTETAIQQKLRDNGGRMFGALLDHLVLVLRELPAVRVKPTRMADFAQWVAATDSILGTHGYDQLVVSEAKLTRKALERDQLLRAVVELMAARKKWNGTHQQLLSVLCDINGSSLTGTTPRKLSEHLRKHSEALRRVGVVYAPPTANSRTKDRKRERTLRLTRKRV